MMKYTSRAINIQEHFLLILVNNMLSISILFFKKGYLKMEKRFIIKKILIIVIICLLVFILPILNKILIGKELEVINGVGVYYNGIFTNKTYGKNFSEEGYCFGKKWQCVEFVKRYYYKKLNHKMPNVYGHAKDFFDLNVKQGQLNKDRGLIQYYNGKNNKPKINDLIVFNDTKFGHVAIVISVTEKYIEVIQQNSFLKTRKKYKIQNKNGCYTIGTKRKPVGWLRKQ